MTHDKLCKLLAALGVAPYPTNPIHNTDFSASFWGGWELTWSVAHNRTIYLLRTTRNSVEQDDERSAIKAINHILERRRLIVERPFIEGFLWLTLRIDRWARVSVEAALDVPTKPMPKTGPLFITGTLARLADATLTEHGDAVVTGLMLDHLKGLEVRPALVDRLLDVDSPLHDHLHRLRIS